MQNQKKNQYQPSDEPTNTGAGTTNLVQKLFLPTFTNAGSNETFKSSFQNNDQIYNEEDHNDDDADADADEDDVQCVSHTNCLSDSIEGYVPSLSNTDLLANNSSQQSTQHEKVENQNNDSNTFKNTKEIDDYNDKIEKSKHNDSFGNNNDDVNNMSLTTFTGSIVKPKPSSSNTSSHDDENRMKKNQFTSTNRENTNMSMITYTGAVKTSSSESAHPTAGSEGTKLVINNGGAGDDNGDDQTTPFRGFESNISQRNNAMMRTPDNDLLSPPDLMRRTNTCTVELTEKGMLHMNHHANKNNMNQVEEEEENDATHTIQYPEPRQTLHRRTDNRDPDVSLSPIRKLSPSSFLRGAGAGDKTVLNTSIINSDTPSSVLGYHFLENDGGVHAIRKNKLSAAGLQSHGKDNHHLTDSDDASSDANSLVSEYGSDIGEIKVRMDDINAMDVLMEEGEEEDDEDCDDGIKHLPSKEHQREEIHREQSNFDHQNALKNEKNVDDDGNNSHDEFNQAFLQSIDLSSSAIEENDVEDSSKSSGLCVNVSEQKPENLEESTPNTPIAAVSAAIRRISTGVSHNIARCNHTEENASSTYEYTPFHDIRNHAVPKSPRFSRHENEELRQQQKQLSPTRKLLASPLRHLRGCLPFDPESGALPYRNANNSPPSSTLRRSHRKSKSWGSGSSDFLSSVNMKGVFGSNAPAGKDQKVEMSNTPQRQDVRFVPDSRIAHRHSSFERIVSFPEGDLTSSWRQSPAVVVLESPQRVGNFDREDAIDILSVLVERSIAFQEEIDPSTSSHPTLGKNAHGNNNVSEANAHTNGLEESQTISSQEVQKCVELLRGMSNNYPEEGRFDHNTRMKVLDKLEHSHTYAIEMKRASLSALKWLRSVDRSSTNLQSSEERGDMRSRHKRIPSDPILLEAMINTSQQQLVERDELNRRLDQELSICRAEIGRLKSMKRNENSFTSPNKSILDEEDDDESSSASSSNEDEFPKTCDLGLSINCNLTDTKNIENDSNELSQLAEARKEIFLLKAQLEEASKSIAQLPRKEETPLHSTVHDETDGALTLPTEETAVTESEISSTPNGVTVTAVNCEASGVETTEKVIDLETETEHNLDSFAYMNCDVLKEDLEKYVDVLRKEDRATIQCLSKQVKELQNGDIKEKLDSEMVNVQMLNAENFITDWSELALPPPPDHDLRSPIVVDLLQQWTSDKSTQESLMKWIETVTQGANPEDIKALQLSDLDHEIRDGFTIHVLPILCRRSDIHIQVTSRANRQTTYDIAVSVQKSENSSHDSNATSNNNLLNSSNILTSSSPHMMAFKVSGDRLTSSRSCKYDEKVPVTAVDDTYDKSRVVETSSVTHSTVTTHMSNQVRETSNKVTAHMPNRVIESQLDHVDSAGHGQYIPGDELLLSRGCTAPQHSIVAGALNAVGGLLRRKATEKHNNYKNEDMVNSRSNLGTPGTEKTDLSSSTCSSDQGEELQPYHRVVSAPPGKIGITFVQYRGHAMISDVYQDSPLNGWVFPSDILIAIDEVPVSGMRVPDIVRLLTARKERQRALRLISSHAMTELLITEESGALIDG